MTSVARVAVLERIAKYAREDRAVTPRSTRLARALDELDRMPAEPNVVWVVTYETVDDSELCGVYDNREAAAQLQKAQAGLRQAEQAVAEADQAGNAAQSAKAAAEAKALAAAEEKAAKAADERAKAVAAADVVIAPLGLALVLRLAPPRFVGLLAGGWYVWVAVGYWLAGEVGAMWARSSPMVGVAFLAALPLGGAFLIWLLTARRSA